MPSKMVKEKCGECVLFRDRGNRNVSLYIALIPISIVLVCVNIVLKSNPSFYILFSVIGINYFGVSPTSLVRPHCR